MELLFKKYFWVIVLVALMLTGYMSGSATSLWLGDKIFGSSASAADAIDALKGGDIELPEWGSKAPMTAEELIKRGIFDSDRAELAGSDDGDGGEGGDDVLNVGETIPETELDIDLVGTILTENPAQSLATMQVEGNGKLLGVGSSILEGKAIIVRIEQRYVLLKEGDELRIVKLWGDKKASGSKGSLKGPSKATPVAVSDKPKSNQTDYKAHVKNTGKYEWQVDKQMLEEELKDLTKIGKQAKIVPNYKGGKYEGFKLIGVRPKSLYRAIGIRSGDVITSINGTDLDSPNKAISLFDQLKGSESVELNILRGGQPVTMYYNIK